MIEINSSKYNSEKKVLVDGTKEWVVRVPGARDELALSQLQRRYKVLEKKLELPTASEEDLNRIEDLENKIYEIYLSLFKDNTSDNSEVKAWLESVPFSFIERFLVEVKEQSEEKEKSDGAEELPKDQ